MYISTPFDPEKHESTDAPDAALPLTLESLEAAFADCEDFQKRLVDFGLLGTVPLCLCWLDGLVSGSDVSEQVLRPLTDQLRAGDTDSEALCQKRILHGSVYRYGVSACADLQEAIWGLCHGFCVLLFPRSQSALSFELRTSQIRPIGEPTLEKSLKGAKDAFTETLRVNTALVRQRIASPSLKLKERRIGRRSQTRLSLLYVEDLAAEDTLQALEARLNALDVDGLLATGALEEYIADAPRSPFPQFLHTERPDRFAMYLLDGRIGLLVDGLPVGLVLPVSFGEFMKVTGDSSMHHLVASSLTVLRYAALLLALLLPGLFVAMVRFHPEMLPTRLLLSIMEAEQDVPFTSAIEVLAMLGAFGLLQEAGLRMPTPLGDTVSIIGALIVGQAAVEAKLVSPIAIIVVAVSGIACYALPSQDMSAALRLWRLGMLLAAIWAGLFGVGLVICLMLLHLADLDSFGVNYTAPLSEGRPWGLWRLLLRVPKPWNKHRDPLLGSPDERRQA